MFLAKILLSDFKEQAIIILNRGLQPPWRLIACLSQSLFDEKMNKREKWGMHIFRL